jgi:hypothetical protein
MSTSPDTTRAEDRTVTAISRWLARHSEDADLRRELENAAGGLSSGQAEVVEELTETLDQRAPRADVEMVARETLEALALGE